MIAKRFSASAADLLAFGPADIKLVHPVTANLPMQFAEAERPRNLEYERTVRRLLRTSDGWERKSVLRAQKVIRKLQKRLAAEVALAAATGDPNMLNIQSLKESLQLTFDRLTPELQAELLQVYTTGLEEYTAGYRGFYKALGLGGPGGARGISNDLAVIAANLTAEQIVAVGPQTIQRISNQIQLAVLGGQNPMDAIRALAVDGKAGADFQAIGPFRTLRQRAEAVVRTETHRMFNVADESQHQQLAEDAPGTLFYWYQFSARNPRSTHATTAAVTQETPIAADALFDVGGYKASYPHDPRLPAKEVVNCNCKKLPDFRAVDLDAIARRTAQDTGEANTQKIRRKAKGATAAAAPDVESKRPTKKK